MSEWLEHHRRPQSAERDKEMAARVTVLSRFLPEPVKAQEFLTKFSVNLMRDPALLQGMETIVRPDISCKECADTTVGGVGPSISSSAVPCFFFLLVCISVPLLVSYLCPSSVRVVATFSGTVLFLVLCSVLPFFP